jgi:putative ABC transport system permease protein
MTNLRYAWRSLARSPGFVTVAVLALGLGLGLSTTMFAVLDAVVNPYVAFQDPPTLFRMNWWFGRRNPMPTAELYRYVRDHTRSFAGYAPVGFAQVAIDLPNREPADVFVTRVTPGWFTVTGIRPELGRVFTASDGDDAIILSHELWRRWFGLRRSLTGATLTVSGSTRSVIGVVPRGSGEGLWLPLPSNIETTGSISYVRPWVRLKPGVTLAQATDELKALANQLTVRYDARQAPFSFELSPVVDRREEIRDIHKAMLGSALAVLLIACVNLAHLMMTRGLARRRELALRLALGAGRGTVVRQMFTECLLITLAGCAVGAAVALWGADILQNRTPPEVGWVGLVQPQLSWRVFALAALAAALSAVLFGLLPALRVAFDLNLDEPLKDDAGTTTGRVRYRYNPLVMAEVGLALVLMMGGGLLLRTVHELATEGQDVNAETLWRGYAFMRRGANDTASAPPPPRRALESAMRGVPGVIDLAFISGHSLLNYGGLVAAEQSEDSSRWLTVRDFEVVSPSYLTVMGLPILRGRNFEPGDASGPGVAILDPLTARRLYPDTDPVGHMIKLGAPLSNGPWVRVIGVARSPKERDGDGRYAPKPTFWVCRLDTAYTGGFVVRAASPDARVPAMLTRQLRQLPGLGVWIGPWDFAHRSEMLSRAFLAKVFVTMGAVALGLAALGLYGVLAYAVTRRMREFAVRVALGADGRQLLRMVLHDGFVMLLGGIGVGAFFALGASRLLDSVLVSVMPSDVVSLAISEALLISAGLAAAWLPARRASRANPMDILRAV